MNTTYILEFIKAQFDEIPNSNSPQCGEALLMISAYILEQIENEPNVFTHSPDERSLRRAFSYCSKISRILTGFANTHSSPIEQKAKQALSAITENEAKLKSVQHDCEECENSAESIKKQRLVLESANSALLAAQVTLEARKADFEVLLAKIESLHQIQSDITDEKIAALRSEIVALEPTVQKRQLEYEELVSQHNTLSKKVTELMALFETANKEDEKLSEDIRIKQIELEKLKNTISTHKQSIIDLTAAIQKANEEYTEMQALIEANNKIAKAIQSSGYTIDDRSSHDSFYRRVDDLNHRAMELESEYDLLLKKVLNEANALLQKISQRQEPNYTGGE